MRRVQEDLDIAGIVLVGDMEVEAEAKIDAIACIGALPVAVRPGRTACLSWPLCRRPIGCEASNAERGVDMIVS
jgi:hypothetical protein